MYGRTISRHEYFAFEEKMRNSRRIHARKKYMLYSTHINILFEVT